MQGYPLLLNRAPTLHRLGIWAFQPILAKAYSICLRASMQTLTEIKWLFMYFLSLEAQAKAYLLMFSHMNQLSLALGDSISIPTQDMLIAPYLLTIKTRRGICTNRYHTYSCKNYQNKTVRQQ